MLSKIETEAFARLTIHSFLLEVIVANQMRALERPAETLAQFRREFLDAVRYRTSAPDDQALDSASISAIHETSVSYAERFFECLDQRVKGMMGK